MHALARLSLPFGSRFDPPSKLRSIDTIGSVCCSTRNTLMPFLSVNGFTGGSLKSCGAVPTGCFARKSSLGNWRTCGVAVWVTVIGFSGTEAGVGAGVGAGPGVGAGAVGCIGGGWEERRGGGGRRNEERRGGRRPSLAAGPPFGA